MALGTVSSGGRRPEAECRWRAFQQIARRVWSDNCHKSSACGMRTRPGVRSCTKGNEGGQNLPGAGRTRGTARPPPALRDAAAPSGARSAPRRLRHTSRSAARTSGRKRWLRHASDGKRQALRKPECPDPVRCDGSTRLERPPEDKAAGCNWALAAAKQRFRGRNRSNRPRLI